MGLRYSPLKIFHYPDKIASLPATSESIRPPIHIRIKPTNVCAHNCSYCSYRNDAVQLGQDMEERDMIPRDKMVEIIDDIGEMGVEAITFSGGGDPFYYPHLLDAAKRLKEVGVSFASLTNGARLQGAVADFFSAHATWIRISIDGWDAESYARYRGVNEKEFGRVIDNITTFAKRGGPCHLGAVIIVDKTNASHVHDLAMTLKGAGVQSLKISPCIIDNDGRKNNEYHSLIYDEVKEQIQRLATDGASSDFELFDSYHLLDEKFDKEYTWCPYLQVLTIIGADLNVYSCQDKAYNLSCGRLGSIKDRRFKDFWMTNKEKFFTINPSVDCHHHCISNSRNMLLIEHEGLEEKHRGFV